MVVTVVMKYEPDKWCCNESKMLYEGGYMDIIKWNDRICFTMQVQKFSKEDGCEIVTTVRCPFCGEQLVRKEMQL